MAKYHYATDGFEARGDIPYDRMALATVTTVMNFNRAPYRFTVDDPEEFARCLEREAIRNGYAYRRDGNTIWIESAVVILVD